MKKDLRIELTKKMVKNSLLELLERHKSYDISVKELCDNAGINRSTFYRHYDNIADVLDEIYKDIITIIYEANVSSTKNPDNALNYIHKAVSFFDEHHEYDSLILSNDISISFLTKQAEDIINPIISNLGIKNDTETHYLVKYLLSGTNGIIREWIQKGRSDSAREISQIIYKLAIRCASMG